MLSNIFANDENVSDLLSTVNAVGHFGRHGSGEPVEGLFFPVVRIDLLDSVLDLPIERSTGDLIAPQEIRNQHSFSGKEKRGVWRVLDFARRKISRWTRFHRPPTDGCSREYPNHGQA